MDLNNQGRSKSSILVQEGAKPYIEPTPPPKIVHVHQKAHRDKRNACCWGWYVRHLCLSSRGNRLKDFNNEFTHSLAVACLCCTAKECCSSFR